MKKNKPSRQLIDSEKFIAERINGRGALIGLFALIGAYSTTGQIIPGYL
tara:strand:+ start:3695 stop:3841 length:147 start_codon:yes stop_codon:yes gene_type:complete